MRGETRIEVLGAALLVAVALAGCQSAVGTGLDQSQADQIVVALQKAGISAIKEPEGGGGDKAQFEVVVSNDDVARSISVMQAAELPHRPEPGLNDVFGQGSLVPTATEERARYTSALAGELARSIESIDGVIDARVHVAIPDTRSFALDEQKPHPRASVLIKHRGAHAPYDDDAIRSLVAGAVEGMRPEDVAVVGVEAPPPPHSAAAALVRIGPIAVTAGSAGALKAVLGASFALNGLLVIGLLIALFRRRARPEAPPSEAG